MTSTTNRTQPPATHPVILLARAVGILLGILATLAHAPAMWAVAIGLAGYALVLWRMRGTWSATTAPAAKTG
ncbi:hypothetical protein ACGRHY_30020 [Streptomyces sp. HK10]|uniref:hypothetical protein n=1 Tax=Streptomyces sp. HK10 TaxID=3373255 RepID=UPI00374A0E6F